MSTEIKKLEVGTFYERFGCKEKICKKDLTRKLHETDPEKLQKNIKNALACYKEKLRTCHSTVSHNGAEKRCLVAKQTALLTLDILCKYGTSKPQTNERQVRAELQNILSLFEQAGIKLAFKIKKIEKAKYLTYRQKFNLPVELYENKTVPSAKREAAVVY